MAFISPLSPSLLACSKYPSFVFFIFFSFQCIPIFYLLPRSLLPLISTYTTLTIAFISPLSPSLFACALYLSFVFFIYLLFSVFSVSKFLSFTVFSFPFNLHLHYSLYFTCISITFCIFIVSLFRFW